MRSDSRTTRPEFHFCHANQYDGPNDNYDLQTSHVLPAFIHKFHDAKNFRRPRRHLLGHRHAPARIPLRRRSRRSLPLSPRKLQRTRNSSMSASAATSPSANLPGWFKRLSASRANSFGTNPNPTARRANDGQLPPFLPSAGSPKSLWKPASARPTTDYLKKLPGLCLRTVLSKILWPCGLRIPETETSQDNP